MNRNDEALDRRLEAALLEHFGTEAPPDLTGSVLARHRAGGERAESAFAAPRATHTTRFATLAAALLGSIVIVAVFLLRDHGTDDTATPPQAPPDWVDVSTRAELDALPVTTSAIAASGFDDEDVVGLLRFTELRALRLRNPEACVHGLGLKVQHDPHPETITDAAFATLVELSELRVLRFEGCYRVTGSELLELVTLPHLEELALSYLDIEDAELGALPHLPNLRRLDLSFDHGFGQAGIRAIVNCRKLRSLSLRGCQQLDGILLASLGELTQLEELDLGTIDGINWRSDQIAKDARAQRIFDHAHRVAKGVGTGVTDVTLTGLARLPMLRILSLDQAWCTSAGIAELSAIATLRVLGLFGCTQLGDELADALPTNLESIEVCGDFTDRFCERLATRLRNLSTVRIPACYEIHDRGVAALCGLPRLRTLELRQCRGLTTDCIDALASARGLTALDLRHCDFVDAPFVARLAERMPWLGQVSTNLDGR